MGPREAAAKIFMKEQRRLDLQDYWKDQIESEGVCPRYFGHFDFASFIAGFLAATFIISVALSYFWK